MCVCACIYIYLYTFFHWVCWTNNSWNFISFFFHLSSGVITFLLNRSSFFWIVQQPSDLFLTAAFLHFSCHSLVFSYLPGSVCHTLQQTYCTYICLHLWKSFSTNTVNSSGYFYGFKWMLDQDHKPLTFYH